jgi:hypothetical protein
MSDKSRVFSALGAGNGFTQCVPRVDVSDFDRWITLSGHKKGDGEASKASKKESFEKAMFLFWMLRRVDLFGKLVTEGEQPTDPKDEWELDQLRLLLGQFDDPPEPEEIEPFQRVCIGFSTGFLETEPAIDPEEIIPAQVQALLVFQISRMYDGATDDEDNFVGYGFGGILEPSFVLVEAPVFGGTTVQSRVELGSFANETDTDGEDFIEDQAYVELDGYWFNVIAKAGNNGEDIVGTVDAETLSASVVNNGAVSFGDTITSEAKVNALEFWELEIT